MLQPDKIAKLNMETAIEWLEKLDETAEAANKVRSEDAGLVTAIMQLGHVIHSTNHAILHQLVGGQEQLAGHQDYQD